MLRHEFLLFSQNLLNFAGVMKFRTEYIAQQADFSLNPEKPVLLLGSCFADNIKQRMQLCRWDACNPFGVLFNPLSIARAVSLALSDRDPMPEISDSIFSHDGIAHSWLFDSKKSGKNQNEVIAAICEGIRIFKDRLVQCDALFITFGTAWCYFLNAREDYVVANCHKQPQQLFSRRRISIGEIAAIWIPLLEKMHLLHPQLKVIFTVSPVRHLKDGFTGNALSKATLMLAVERICETMGFCSYFPAYEILNDDLRDYRFYASDLAHPSDMAVDYIWDILKSTYIDDRGALLLKEGEKITRRSLHRNIIS